MSRAVTASTRITAVIGDPVRHSLSPALHNAAFQASGLDWLMVALPAPSGTASTMVNLVRNHEVGGLAVTMPLKTEMASIVDRLDATASALRSVNTVVPSGGEAVGMSTDGDGFVASLRSEGHDPAGSSIVVIGAGGAARSIIDALHRAGVARVAIHNRTQSAAEEAAALSDRAGVVPSGGLESACAEADIIVNTTSVGMGQPAAVGELPVPASLLAERHVVVDIVYHPLQTGLLAAATAVGARAVDGLGMLVHQAALQSRAWTGFEADTSAMRAAAEAELAARQR